MIYLDIETLRSPEEHRLQLLEETKTNFKAPSSLTKGVMAKDLGLSDKEAKFISAGDLKERWEKELAEDKSISVANEKWEKTSLNPDVSPIACICISFFDGEENIQKDFSLLDGDEKDLLRDFHTYVDYICSEFTLRPYFIGHNLIKFDLPFIWKRSIINNVKPVNGVKWIDARHNKDCYDTMAAWAGYGNKISADNLAKLLGIQGKSEMDGSKVYDTWQKNPLKVIDYCHDDVEMVKQIHERLSL